MVAATTLDGRAPPTLRELQAVFSSLEFSLSSLALYKHSADWEAVKLAVESSRQITFTKEHLQQIIALSSHAYTLSWSRPSRKRARATGDGDDRDPVEPVLLIRRERLPTTEMAAVTLSESETPLPRSETIADRIGAFTVCLNTFIQAKVDAILAATPTLTGQEVRDALENVEIPRAPLPEKDSLSTQQQSQQRLDEVTRKNQVDLTAKDVQEALEAPVPEDLKSLPKWLIDKVRRQEQQSKKVNQRSDQAVKQRLYTSLPQLSDQIQSLTLVQRKYVFLFSDLVKSVTARAPIRDQIEEQIHLLEEIVPFWITVFFSDGKEYVKLTKTHKYNTVKAALRTAVASMAKDT